MAISMAPSILSADFMNLQRDVMLVATQGADVIHFDVMDGHFVPNLTLGVPFVKAMKRFCPVPLDVHLMIDNPLTQVDWFIDAGADIVTIHIEACDSALACARILQHIRSRGVRAGVAINPETPQSALEGTLEAADVVMAMSVHPGFGGQSFIPETLDKITALCALCAQAGVSPTIEVDGGINVQTAALAAKAGATLLVAGNAVFAQPDPVAAMQDIRAAAQSAVSQREDRGL